MSATVSSHAGQTSAGHSELVPLPQPVKRRHWLRNTLLILLALMSISLVTLLVAEARTSHFQAQELSRYAGTLTYTLSPGPSERIVFPQYGPFDIRLGYTRLPQFEARLRARDFVVERQARFSPALLDYTQRGFFPPYAEKTRAGLTLQECRGETLYTFRHPQRHYPHFDAVPPLVLQVLLFIENRELLDARSPYANPAVDWPRFAKAAMSQVGRALDISGQSSGGSTLATQVEKYRHSPQGMTGSAREKLRQMISASVRGYRQGPQTLAARQDVALDYLNSVPLSAAPGYGEVHGIGDGLWVWFDTDFDALNRLLVPSFNGPANLQQQGLALRQVVALMIAQRRPSWYLTTGRQSLERLTDSYLRILAEADVIDPLLRDAALAQQLSFRDFARDPVRLQVERDKGLQVARGQLGGLLGSSFYDLDRLDLSARTTLHGGLQRQVTDYLYRLADPEFADEIGLIGERLLSPEKTAEVNYSFTLFERGEDGYRVRIQTDNTGQPFDINEGSKLELGSTAKLRVLATYLEVIAELHQRHAGKPIDALRAIEVDRQDALSRWVIDQLTTHPELALRELLDAAMQRRYSASPHEAFFTGGGRHTFSNFRREDNGRNPTLSESMQESLNLPFVRLLRDLVRYSIHQNERRSQLLEDDQDPRRQDYLQRFADREGRVFLQRFWRKYRDKESDERLALFLDGLRTTAPRLSAVHRYLFPEADEASFGAFIRERLPNEVLSEQRIASLYRNYAPGSYDLSDQGYIARVHPLELWLLGYLLDHPEATFGEAAHASRSERQEVYGWLFKTRHRNARDVRIRTMLEVEAFLDIHQRWARLGYPFEHLVPSLATAVGSSGDRPAALAELMGIILNDGVRLPTLRIDDLHFAADTPYETRFVPAGTRGQRVMEAEVAAVLRETLSEVVEGGTARRLQGSFSLDEETPLVMGGKTGTGNNRFETVGRGGQVLSSQARNRTATFVFYLGDDHFGTLTAFVPGSTADNFRFTSALPVQVLKGMQEILRPLLAQEGDGCLPGSGQELLVAEHRVAPGSASARASDD
ncbi:Membrane carboxypeptidase (penicillin-binding protein) [Franzmannia pantelleriensis]|uniref:peptidoglycan glycosyltransferase n=1 Tax=Franzmannia pantelleriensis TaxID=48727 RepID=A0A1G9M5M0_9GAMM|nr:transglycosylase domain-containing protein [Halomonas pantelleriensis]SDL69241.1 Membrane carboxypeptidase (penicillin-binding protein) [Halomonas pantelleriensis]